jgi:hypothetical protein
VLKSVGHRIADAVGWSQTHHLVVNSINKPQILPQGCHKSSNFADILCRSSHHGYPSDLKHSFMDRPLSFADRYERAISIFRKCLPQESIGSAASFAPHRSARSAASGALSRTLRSALAGPVGDRLPCSQFLIVSNDTSIRSANSI